MALPALDRTLPADQVDALNQQLLVLSEHQRDMGEDVSSLKTAEKLNGMRIDRLESKIDAMTEKLDKQAQKQNWLLGVLAAVFVAVEVILK